MTTTARTSASQLTVHSSPSRTSLEKEADDGRRELEKGEEATQAVPNGDVDDFPDGGMKAWLVLLGVRTLLISIGAALTPFSRLCVTHLQRTCSYAHLIFTLTCTEFC